MTVDPYLACPSFGTPSFTVDEPRDADAQDLLDCYADPLAQALFNADHCTSDFRYATLAEMRDCLAFWRKCYRERDFVRFAVRPKDTGKALGTLEMFGAPGFAGAGRGGCLRMDLAPPLETRGHIAELLALAEAEFFGLFGVTRIVTKAVPAATGRLAALRAAGYAPLAAWEPRREHYHFRDQAR